MKRRWARPRLVGTAFAAVLTLAVVVGIPTALASGATQVASAPATVVGDANDESGTMYHYYQLVNQDTGTINVADIFENDCAFASATIHWGDGNDSTGTLVSDGGSGQFVQGNHTYTTQGQYAVSVDAVEGDSCGDGSPGPTDNFSGGIIDVGPATNGSGSTDDIAQAFNVTGTENVSTGIVKVANMHSSECNHEFGSVTIDWGDGTGATPGSLVDDGFGGDYVTGAHTYADEGTFPITVVGDETTGCASESADTFTVTGGNAVIADAPLTPTDGSTQNAVEGAAMNNATLGTFTDGNTAATAGSFSVQICWNDTGTPPPNNDCESGSATGGGGNFSVVASHTFPEEGDYTVVTTVTDGSQSVTIHTPVHVTDASLHATGVKFNVPQKSFTKVVANFTDDDPNGTTTDYSATIDWGDGSGTSGGLIAPNNSGGWSVTGTHKYTSPSAGRTITVTINDTGGASTQTTSVAKVNGK